MRRLSLVIGIALAVLLALGTGTASKAGQPYTYVVDNVTPQGCMQPQKNVDTTITDALAEDLQDGDTIYVCSGTYNEPQTLYMTVAGVSLVGPRNAQNNDEAHVSVQTATGNDVLEIDADHISVSGLTIDASNATNGIVVSGSNSTDVTIENNEVSGGSGTGIRLNYAPGSDGHSNELVQLNHVVTSLTGIECSCDYSQINDNDVESATQSGITGISLGGSYLTATGNTVTRGGILVDGDVGVTISDNDVTGNNGDGFLLSLDGGNYTVTDNHLSDTEAAGIYMTQGYFSADATILRNHFTNVGTGIQLYDAHPEDALTISATIGSHFPADANIFRNSGGTPNDDNDLLNLYNIPDDITAENNDWGLCTDADIAKEIYDHADDSSLGTVDYDPFVPGPSCPTRTPSPTPIRTPTPSPTPTHSATPTPSPSPTASPAGQRTWGDIDCDGSLAALDGLKLLDHVAELAVTQTQPCPEIGTSTNISIAAGTPHKWGDIDCDTDVDVSDVLGLLSGVEGIPLDNLPDGCPVVGGGVIVIGG